MARRVTSFFFLACFAFCGLALPGLRCARAGEEISPHGEALAKELDAMAVTEKWPAGVHVNWQTGEPDGRPVSTKGRHTHCSAFVASAAKHLGIYILRPPEHGQEFLANAQDDWLAVTGVEEGWVALHDGAEAQDAANRGEFVVAAYRNHHDDKPGHIAIVRPGLKDAAAIAREGPDVIQAGTVNARAISLKDGFSGHPAAWTKHEVEYYAHAIKW